MKKPNKLKVQPLGDRVLVEAIEEKEVEKTKTGIYLPTSGSKEEPDQGKVVAVGDSKKIKVGDVVIFSKYGFDKITVDGKDYLVIKEENILAVVKK